MKAIHPIRVALAALALLATTSSCGREPEDSPTPPSGSAPVPSEPDTADILVEVVRGNGAPVLDADVSVNLTDGTVIRTATDGGGRVWVEAPIDHIGSIIASKDASSFEAIDGALVYERVANAEPVVLIVERDAPLGGIPVRGEVLGLVDTNDELMLTTTADARITLRSGGSVFSLLVPEPEPFVLLGVEWHRVPDSSARNIHRDLVAFAHADSGRPVTDGMWLDLDFTPIDNLVWEPGEPVPWTRREISGTFTAPRDATLAERGRADLSLHFLGAKGRGYLGGATFTAPTADGYHYDVRYEAPLPGAVETLITVSADGAESGAWLLGPPPEGRLELDLLSPPRVVVDGEDVHHAITWALRPEEDHDRTILHFRRQGRLLGRMIAPAYHRWAALPIMPTAEAEMELVDGPIELVVETCDSDPVQNRCERYARSAPTTVRACALPFCDEP